jgi:phage terminase large subunit-like protein
LEYDWRFWGRPSQFAPADPDWRYWLFMAGRGAGKTRSGAEWVRELIRAGWDRIGLIAPTAGDARDVMVEGSSGLLGVCHKEDRDNKGNLTGRPLYESSKRQITWQNGAIAKLYSAEEPERLRGPQHQALWCDELAAWQYLRETWDMAMFGLRIGANPRVLVTTTPKPLTLLRELLKDPGSRISRGSTFDNAANLAPSFIASIKEKYDGTRLGRQEIFAELLDETEGALWKRAMIDACYLLGPAPEMARIVVAVDPAITAKEESDETGIVACGLGKDKKGYLLKDVSGRYSPGDWAKKAIALYHLVGADKIIAEGNQGGDMVRHTIQTEWPNAPVKIVHASRGKAARAEPVAALYEQGRMHHIGAFPELEDQLVTWEPLSGLPSPDRLDALVWGFTELMIVPTHSTPVFGTFGSR